MFLGMQLIVVSSTRSFSCVECQDRLFKALLVGSLAINWALPQPSIVNKNVVNLSICSRVTYPTLSLFEFPTVLCNGTGKTHSFCFDAWRHTFVLHDTHDHLLAGRAQLMDCIPLMARASEH